jgi:hypothetical protein
VFIRLLSWWTGGLAISSLSDSVRVNTRYNVLNLHT